MTLRWPEKPLEEVVRVTGGSTPSRERPEYWGGDIPWVTPTDLPMPGKGIATLAHAGQTITGLGLESCAANLLPPGTVLFSSRATIGKLGIITVPMATNQGFVNLIPKPGTNSRFLAYSLWVRIKQIEGLAGSTTFKEVNRGNFKQLRIPVPPLPEQERIVSILDAAEELRCLREQADRRTADLIPAVFHEMFGDPAINPKGWPQKSLGKFLTEAEIFVDGDWVESKDQDPTGEVRLVQLADIGDGSYLNKSARFLTMKTAERLNCTFLRPGDILIARMPDPLGRACIFPGDSKDSVTVVDVCVIRPDRKGPDPLWLMCCINSIGFRSTIARYMTGTTRGRISRGNLSQIPTICPPITLQRDFAARATAIHSMVALQAKSRRRLDDLFQSLLHRAFNGGL